MPLDGYLRIVKLTLSALIFAIGDRSSEQRDELAALHSITSSARAMSVGGISSPSDFAVLRLITSWNLVGCSTGRSLGFAPLKILSRYTATRCCIAGTLGP